MKPKPCLYLVLFLCSLGLAFAEDYKNEALSNTAILVDTPPSSSIDLLGCTEMINGDPTQPVFLHFYDAASAGAVTVGTTASVLTLAVPAGPGYRPYPINGSVIHSFRNGMVIAATTSRLSSVSTAPTTALVVFLTYAKR